MALSAAACDISGGFTARARAFHGFIRLPAAIRPMLDKPVTLPTLQPPFGGALSETPICGTFYLADHVQVDPSDLKSCYSLMISAGE